MSHLKGWCRSPILLPKRAAKIWSLFIYSPIISIIFIHRIVIFIHSLAPISSLSSSTIIIINQKKHQPSMDINGPSTINHQPSTINHHPSILNLQSSTIIVIIHQSSPSSFINHRSSIINHYHESQIINNPWTINHKSKTINHHPNHQSQIINHKSSIGTPIINHHPLFHTKKDKHIHPWPC